MGHKVFVPFITETNEGTLKESEVVFYCNRKGIDASCVRTSEGFVVKKGSRIDPEIKKSCPEYTIKRRQQYKNMIDENYILLDDILFNTPSGAASFVCGSSANGNVEWKTKDGRTLKYVNNES